MGVTLTDVLLFGKAGSTDVDNAKFAIYRRNILRWGGIAGYVDMIVSGVPPLSLPDAIAGGLQYVKAFGGTEQRNLPDGYIQRQFIYMMDGSYLLTDVVPTYDGRVEMDFQTTTLPASSVYFLGGRTVGYGGLFFVRTINDGFIVDAFGTGSADRYASSVFPANNTRYKFTYDNQVAKVESGGTTLFTKTFSNTNANGAALCINGLNSDGEITPGQAGIYLYSFKVWNAQGELVADYVPAIQKGTVPVVGFYDTVSGTFKTATAGTFAAGGEAVPTPDAPMDIVSNNGVLKARHASDPVEIYTDGVVETINIHSKNLFDKAEQSTDYFYNNYGTESSVSLSGVKFVHSAKIPCKPNTRYVLSGTRNLSGDPYNYKFTFWDKNGDFISYENPGDQVYQGDYSRDTTTPNNCYYIAFNSFANDTNVQLEQGSTATTYEPYYDGGTATAEMLLSLGDYTDEQEIISGAVTRKMGVKVLDGTENWISGGGGTGVWANFQSITGVAFATTNAFCSHSVYGGANINIVDMNQNEFCLYDNGNISFKNTYSTSTDDWKTFLADQYAAGTPVIIVYPLATETTDTVTGQPMNTTAGDNILEITQASLEDLEVEVKYQKVV